MLSDPRTLQNENKMRNVCTLVFFQRCAMRASAKLNPEMQNARIPAPRRKNVARIRPAARPGFERRPAVPMLRASPQILLSFGDAANPQTCWFQELPPVKWRSNDKNRSGQANNKAILQGTWILCALLDSILKCSCLLRLAGLPLILDFHICVTPAALKVSLSGCINSASLLLPSYLQQEPKHRDISRPRCRQRKKNHYVTQGGQERTGAT